MATTKICKKCLLRDLEKEGRAHLEKYLAAVKEEDKVDEELYEKRLQICRDCERLVEATCEACGCYVEFRALVKHGKCPYKKW